MDTQELILLSQKMVLLSLTTDENEKQKLVNEINELTATENRERQPKYCGHLKFNDKEISKMPKNFRKEFRIQGCTAHVRKRCDGRYSCSYEIRYRRNGYSISVSAKTIEEAKTKFLQRLNAIENPQSATVKESVPSLFTDFATFWFENFHRRKVVEDTYKNNLRVFRNSLATKFADRQIKSINAKELQDLLDEIIAEGKGKKAEDVYGLIRQIFDAAVRFHLIQHNPADMIIIKKHERKHGVALTIEEEQKLLAAYAGTRFQLMFAVALYTGLRPNEYKSVRIDGDMLIAVNSKRKGGEVAYKRIPVNAMLKPYLEGITTVKWVKLDTIRKKFNAVLPNHKLYDLRTTFYTHCVTCGVAESARDEMVGHSGGKLKDTYTDLPDDYLKQEAAKLIR